MIHVDTSRGTRVDILVSSPLMEVNSRALISHVTRIHNSGLARTHAHMLTRTHMHSRLSSPRAVSPMYARHSVRLVISHWGDRKVVQGDSDSSIMCIKV